MLVAELPLLLPWGWAELLQVWATLGSGLEPRLAALLLSADWSPSLLPQGFQTFLCFEGDSALRLQLTDHWHTGL